MSTQNIEWRDTIPGSYFVYNILILVWIIVAIFTSLDPSKLIYTVCMFAGSILSVYYLSLSRRQDNMIYPGVIGFYVLSWLGITTFSNSNQIVDLLIVTSKLKNFEFLSLFPILMMWLRAKKSDTFFRLVEMDYRDKISWIWKSIIVILFIVNSLDFNPRFQFLILIPMIAEPMTLTNNQKTKLPTLTLFINKEMLERFAIPISLVRTIFIILFAFMFGFLSSRLWVLILLGFMAGGFGWVISILLANFSDSEDTINIEDYIDNLKNSDLINFNKEPSDASQDMSEDSKDIEVSTGHLEIVSTTSPASSTKARDLGLRVRKELQKPRYNLNHILSTLSNEDFSRGFKVTKTGLKFKSLKGDWLPPTNLILFPIQMAKYDIRRADEILLMGFNTPDKDIKPKRVKRAGSRRRKEVVKFSKNRIQMGDLAFNMQTILVKQRDWKDIQDQLEIIDESSDIKYTGFDSLSDMQSKLISIGDKWLAVRQQFQEATVEFISGLLGSAEPVFTDLKQLTEAPGSDDKDQINPDDYEIQEDN